MYRESAYLQLGLLTISRFARNTPSWLDPREGACLNTKVEKISETREAQVLETNKGTLRLALWSIVPVADRSHCQISTFDPKAKIPFRENTTNLSQRNAISSRRWFIRFRIQLFLPRCPLHCMIDGSVHQMQFWASSAKVIRKQTWHPRLYWGHDLPRFLETGSKTRIAGIQEIIRPSVKQLLYTACKANSEVQASDLVPTHAGVRKP